MIQVLANMKPADIHTLWPVSPPSGISDDKWKEIHRMAVKYRPRKNLEMELWELWRDFAIASLAASQPRRHASVGNRLGSFARHIEYNRPDFANCTVGEVFSDRALRVTLLRSKASGVSKPGCAHVKRDIASLRNGLLGDPLKFVHVANQPSSAVTPLEVVKWAAAHGREREKLISEDIFRWFHHEDIHNPFPKNKAVTLSAWCISQGFNGTFITGLRGQHALRWSHKFIQPVTVLSLPAIDAAFIRVTRTDEIVIEKALRGNADSWSMHLLAHATTVNQTKGFVLRPVPEIQPPRAKSRAEIKREIVRRDEGMSLDIDALPDSLEFIMASIELKVVTPKEWEIIRPMVATIMRRAHIRGEVSFKRVLRVVAMYVSWARRNGYQLSLETLMAEEPIETWVKAGLSHEKASTRNSYRGFLRRVASFVNPSYTAPVKIDRIARQSVRPPYSGPEVRRIIELAEGIENPAYRGQAMASIALGLGAGLDSSDLAHLRIENVKDRGEDGIQIGIEEGRNRDLWLMHQFEPLLRSSMRLLPPTGVLVCPQRKRRSGPVSELYGKIVQIGNYPVPIEQGRMRATWLCALMNAPIPLIALLGAAGLSTATTLSDLMQYATNTHPTDLKSILQGA